MRTIGRAPARAHDAALQKALAPLIREIRAGLGSIVNPRDAQSLAARIERDWPDSRIAEIVRDIGAKALRAAEAPWRSVRLKPRKDANGDDLIDTWSRRAIRLITSVRDEALESLRKDVVRALRAGTSAAELAAQWRRGGIPLQFGTLEGRVRVIAQHQLSSLHAQAQRARATSVGVTQFVWRTQGDSRVREAHRALAGKVFDYSDPPSEGLPGTPVNCRCYAESVIPDDLVAIRVRSAPPRTRP